MSFTDHKITQFVHRIVDLPDQPNLPADELKARFDSSPEELRQAVNGICDDADRLDDRVSGIIAETFGDTITEDMLSDELINNVAWKSDLYCGSYTGDGVYPRTITIGFTPRMVYIRRADGFSGFGSDVYAILTIASDILTNTCILTTNGFQLRNDEKNCYLNTKNEQYVFIAIK